MIKNILFTIILLQSISVFSNTEVDTFVETLDKFDEYCIDQNDELREDVYISDKFFSCREALDYLKIEFKNREELMSSNPDVYQQFQDCVENRTNPKVIPFVSKIQEVADNVTCNESEKKEFEKDCSKAWECNKLRAIKDGAGTLPSIIRKPIQKFVRNTVREKRYDSECIADGKSNCVKDFVYAFAANLWSSAKSVWDLVSKGTKSLFDLGGWFDDEADKLHAKAVQSKKDVEDFWDDPGKWFSNLIDNIKRGVDDWVKSSVFCSKWEGKPQFSKCLQPLESYDCIDCDDRINATCVAIGAISSEVGVAFLTAGVGTAANLTARAGAKTLAAVATKVSAKVKTVAPSFSKKTKLGSQPAALAKASAVVGAGVSKSTEVAKKIYSITSEKALKIKGKIGAISKAVAESKVVMVTSKVIEKGNIPGRISEKIAEKGVLLGAKTVSKVGSGAVKADADKLIRVAEKARSSERAQKLLSQSTHEKSRLSGHNAKATTLVKRGEKVPDGSSHLTNGGGSHNTQNDHGSRTNYQTNRDAYSTGRDSYSSSKSERVSSRPSEKPRKSAKAGADRNKQDTQKDRISASREEAKKAREQRRKEEQRKITEKKKDEAKKANEEHSEDQNSRPSKKAIAASLATHLSAKGLMISSEEAEKEAQRLSDLANGKSDDFKNDLTSAKKVLGVDGKSAFSKSGLEQAKSIKKMYSEENKDKIVSDIQKSNSELSQSDAEKMFEKRSGDVNKAYDYMASLQEKNKISSTSSKRSAKDELKSIGRESELSKLDSELADLAKKRESFESSLSDVVETNERADTPQNINSSQPSESLKSSSPIGKKISRELAEETRSSSSSVASSPSSNSSSSTLSNNSSFEGSSSSFESSNSSTSKDEDVPSIVDNELIEEAISKTKSTEETDKDVKKKSKSSDLKKLLSKIGDKPVQVVSNTFFTRDLSTIKTPTSKSKEIFELLSKKVSESQKVEKKTIYQLGSEKLELYQYNDRVFHLKIKSSGVAELIDSESGSKLINRSAFNRD